MANLNQNDHDVINSEGNPHVGSVVFEGGPEKTIESHPTTMAEQLQKFQTGKNPYHAKLTTTEDSPTETKEEVGLEGEKKTKEAVEEEVFLGGKKYTRTELERKLERAEKIEAKLDEKPPAPTPTAITPPPSVEEELAEIMFTDPKEYTRRLKEVAKTEIKQEDTKEKNAEKVRINFYTQNKDLVGHEDLVQFFAEKMRGDLAKETDEAALSKLAQAVRNKISTIRGKKEATETLPSRPAMTAGTQGNPVLRPSEAKEKPGDFISQMKQAFKRGQPRY